MDRPEREQTFVKRFPKVFSDMIYAILAILAGYALLVAALALFQRNLMYHPDSTVPTPASFGVPEMALERLETSDGHPLLAWWRAPVTPDKPVLLYLHGNAGHLGDRADKVRPYLDEGYGVLLLSYRYNAGAGGKPSEAGLALDARTALEVLKARGVDPSRIVLYGESLGTGLVVRLASEDRVGAVVLEAPYSSIADVAASIYWYVPVRWLLKDHFDSTARIASIEAPLLIVHGGLDSVIAPRFAEKLYEAAVDPKEFVMIDEAHHTNLYDFGMGGRVVAFIEATVR